MADATGIVKPEDHVVGPEDAPLLLVEYGDYECPYCGRAHASVRRLLEQEGARVRFVFRHFPLTHLHRHALEAAEAAEAASAQGKFWPMHDLLYDNQSALERDALLSYAEELGLDVERFEADLDDHRFLDRVQRDAEEGERVGVDSTPSFFVNGERYEGGYSLSELLDLVRGGAGLPAP